MIAQGRRCACTRAHFQKLNLKVHSAGQEHESSEEVYQEGDGHSQTTKTLMNIDIEELHL